MGSLMFRYDRQAQKVLWRVEWVFAAPSPDVTYVTGGEARVSKAPDAEDKVEGRSAEGIALERASSLGVRMEDVVADAEDAAAGLGPSDAALAEAAMHIEEGELQEDDSGKGEEPGGEEDLELEEACNSLGAACPPSGPAVTLPAPPLIPAYDAQPPTSASGPPSGTCATLPPALRMVDDRLPEDLPLIEALQAHLKYRPGAGVRQHALR